MEWNTMHAVGWKCVMLRCERERLRFGGRRNECTIAERAGRRETLIESWVREQHVDWSKSHVVWGFESWSIPPITCYRSNQLIGEDERRETMEREKALIAITGRPVIHFDSSTSSPGLSRTAENAHPKWLNKKPVLKQQYEIQHC